MNFKLGSEGRRAVLPILRVFFPRMDSGTTSRTDTGIGLRASDSWTIHPAAFTFGPVGAHNTDVAFTFTLISRELEVARLVQRVLSGGDDLNLSSSEAQIRSLQT